MKKTTLLQWGFAGCAGIWGALMAGGTKNWFTEAFGYLFLGVLGFAVIGVALFLVAWMLKAAGVIAALPWALDRKINPPSQP